MTLPSTSLVAIAPERAETFSGKVRLSHSGGTRVEEKGHSGESDLVKVLAAKVCIVCLFADEYCISLESAQCRDNITKENVSFIPKLMVRRSNAYFSNFHTGVGWCATVIDLYITLCLV